MPIEIRELSIKINVSEGASGSTTSAAPASNGSTTADTGNNAQQDALIAQVVEKVLELLKRQSER